MQDWAPLYEFPNYEVSRSGEVRSTKSGRIIAPSKTMQGAVKVGLNDHDNIQRTRSVKTLVAEAFVDGRNATFNTPVHRDGNQENNHADNLCWRPRWFALKWTREFNQDLPSGEFEHYYYEPIFEINQRQYYDHVAHAAQATCCLHWDIFKSVNRLERVFPDGLRFRFVTDNRLGPIGSEQEYQYLY